MEQLNINKSVIYSMKMLEVYKFIRRVFIPIVIPLAVCACSVKVAIDANEIAKMQAIIILNSTTPEIDVCEDYERNGDGECKRYINISVLGGRATNLKIKGIAFIDVEPDYYAEKYFDGIVQIPCNDYYCGMIWNSESYDQHYYLVNGYNYDTISILQDLLDNYYKDFEIGFSIKLHSYEKVGYVNVLGEDKVIYFSVGGFLGKDEWIVGSDYVMNENIGEAKFKEYDKLLEDGIYLDLCDYDALLSDFLYMVENSSSWVASDSGLELYIE